MSVLSRYLLRHFFTMLGLILPTIVGLYLVVELFERLDDIFEAGAPGHAALAYFLLTVPQIVFELIPLAILFAGLLTVMLLSRHSEIIAIRAAGVSPRRFIMPFLLVALLLGWAAVAAQILFIPRATERARTIWQTEVDKAPSKGVLKGNRLFYHGENSLWTSELAKPDASDLRDLTLLRYDEGYVVREVLAASDASFSNGKWIFRNGIRKERSEDSSIFSVHAFDQLVLKLPEAPRDLVAVLTPPGEMDIPALFRSVRRMKQTGYVADEYETELWGQLLYPFLGLTLLLFGIPLVVSRERGGLALGLAIGLLFGFVTWVSWSFVLTLGKTGQVPPFMAPHLVHGTLTAAGLIMLRRLRF